MSVGGEGHHENRLARETSPYLRQHARNPVDWYPWGEEAFERARREDKPILLSVGYATCHWCHVMARESFEDEATAALMNAHFVSVKVDREERPDVDELYMQATLAMHGQGGWPMTAFLTPEREPFFAGTYFPPEPRGGMPSFRQVLTHVADRWRDDRATLLEGASQLTHVLASSAALPLPSGVGRETLHALLAQLEQSYDTVHGGFGRAPKFPPHAVLGLLLRLAAKGSDAARTMALGTLDAMARGGIRDHIGGGFSRYATDAAWLVPHFEKMLYDNAQLARLYLEAHQLTGLGSHRRVAIETLEFMLDEMRDESGAFVSAYDADSEGEEGAFYVFTHDEILEVCGEDGPAVARAFGASRGGNFEGKNVLHRPEPLDVVASALGMDKLRLQEAVERGRRALLARRALRERPFLDDKVIASWNGLAISALVAGYEVLGEPRYLEAARRAAEAVFTRLFDGHRLGRTYRGASIGRGEGVLEDYALMAEASLDLFEATAEPVHRERALALTARIRGAFRPEGEAIFTSTSADAEALVARRTDASDGALPSAQGVVARLLVRLSHHLGDPSLAEEAAAVIRAHGRPIARSPRAYATMLEAAHALLEGPVELVLTGEDPRELERALRAIFVPHRVMLRVRPGDRPWPLSEGRVPSRGEPARLYVCHAGTCGVPVLEPRDVQGAVHAAARREVLARIVRSPRPGRATKEATAGLLGAHGLREGSVVGAGESALVLPRLVPNLARVPDVEEMLAIVEASVRAGIGAFDLTGVVHRDSLEAAGEAIADVIARDLVSRESVTLVCGLGRFLRDELRGLEVDVVGLEGTPEVLCLHPSALERGLERVIEGLGFSHVDLVVLELADAEVDRASLVAAFSVLEAERAAGRVGRFGVALEHLPKSLESFVERCLSAAEDAGGKDHGLSLLAMPVNLAEGLAEARSLDRLARRASLTLASSSPLESRTAAVRLVDVEGPDGEREDTASTFAGLAAIETEFEQGLGATLRFPDGSSLGRFFDLTPTLESIERGLDDPSMYRRVEAEVVAAPIEERFRALDRACGGSLREPWDRFKARYAAALDRHLAALRAEMDARQARKVGPLLRALDPFLPVSMLAEPLSKKALHLLLSHPVLDLVFVPVERAEEVGALAALFDLPAVRDPNGAIDALVGIGRGSA